MKDSDLVKDIASIDNLMLAWGKLEGEMLRSDDWCDIMEFYAYKFTLKDNLIDLRERLLNGTYRMQALRPLPFPKGCKRDAEGHVELRVRQYFHVGYGHVHVAVRLYDRKTSWCGLLFLM